MEKPFNLISILLLCTLPKQIVSSVPADSTNDFDSKIVGGYNTTIQQFPHQVFLVLTKSNKKTQCGGSLISRRYVLTAAHCLTGVSQVTGRVGSTYTNRGGKRYSSRIFGIHSRYNSTTFDYDIGYVRFSTITIDGVNSKIIRLPPARTPVAAGTVLSVAGWGDTSEGGTSSTSLRAVNVPVREGSVCQKRYGTFTIRMICVGSDEGGKNTCQGDSGGAALSQDGIQRGIVSHAIGCARPHTPGVFTDVSSLRDWIRRHTGV